LTHFQAAAWFFEPDRIESARLLNMLAAPPNRSCDPWRSTTGL
jgi:hypothetical protein